MDRHAPDLTRHFEGRSLAIGAGHSDDRVRVRLVELGRQLRKKAPRLFIGEKGHAFHFRPRPGNDRHRATLDRLTDELLAVEHSAFESSEHISTRNFAVVDRKARYLGIAMDVRQLGKAHWNL